jgi:hypothetical protein
MINIAGTTTKANARTTINHVIKANHLARITINTARTTINVHQNHLAKTMTSIARTMTKANARTRTTNIARTMTKANARTRTETATKIKSARTKTKTATTTDAAGKYVHQESQGHINVAIKMDLRTIAANVSTVRNMTTFVSTMTGMALSLVLVVAPHP